ncbi:hypothetical protein V865_001505 [Kwoniella europaea PYCC6329]|uniref:Uncharacterized protein n=1 Tax=Kwoniella europaea PYCC6329 TaxID=1423913 RepID=A0AAX4KCB4_9TREE
MPPKRITRSHAQASQPPVSQASATAVSGHARHSRGTDVEPTRHFKGWEYVEADRQTPQPEVQAPSAIAQAREARAANRASKKGFTAPQDEEFEIERIIREIEDAERQAEQDDEIYPIVLGGSSPEETDDDGFHTPGVHSGIAIMDEEQEGRTGLSADVEEQSAAPRITVETMEPGAFGTKRRKRRPLMNREKSGVYVLRDGDPDPDWLERPPWDTYAMYSEREQAEMLESAVNQSLAKDASFKRSSLSCTDIQDLKKIARSCSISNCEYSAEKVEQLLLDEIVQFLSGKSAPKDHESLIRTSIERGTARCSQHSNETQYPYPEAEIIGWSGCGHLKSKARSGGKHGLLMPVWNVTGEDGEKRIRRMWQIANDATKTLAVTCSNRDAASYVHSCRRKITVARTREPAAATSSAPTPQANALSLMPPPSLPGIPFQPGHQGVSVAQTQGSKYAPWDWRASHHTSFLKDNKAEFDLMLDGFQDWSCWNCEKTVANQPPVESSSRDAKFRWMNSAEYQKAMSDWVEYGTFVCDDDECKTLRRDFMREQGHQIVTCPSLQGCSTAFNMVNNDTGNRYFAVEQTDTNSQKIYRLCSQPCTALTSLRVADSNYRTSGQQFKDATDLIERS